MANLSENKSRTLGSIAAIRTLLDRYPTLLTVTNDGSNTSFGFMFSILRVLGVTEADIINKWSTILSGKAGDGILEGIEAAVKGILLANVKNMFTCTMNPLIPNDLMHRLGTGIELDLDTVDTYGILANCPVDENGGSTFYFDAINSDYNIDDANDADGGINPYSSGYTVNELWKSRDFNAFLWYVINKGQAGYYENEQKLYWDNRVSFLNDFARDTTLKNNFFNAQTNIYSNIVGGGQPDIPIPGSSISKKQFIRCEFVERPTNSIKKNVLKVYLNPYRYYRTRKIAYRSKSMGEVPIFSVNKTIFEFNYDYIRSLKLFSSKTLLSHILNAMFGLVQNMSLRFTIKREVIAAQIREIVRRVIVEDDTASSGGKQTCYYTFSNDEYERMLQEALQKKNGTYVYDGSLTQIDYEAIYKSVNDIDKTATLAQQAEAIANAITTAKNASQGHYEQNRDLPDVYYIKETGDFSFGVGIIYRLIEETVTQIVMQVLSPKVAILFKINSYVMGDLDPESDSWQLFMKNYQNLVIALIRDIKNLLLDEMYNWLRDELLYLIELFTSKLMLETIRSYRELLTQLMRLCLPTIGGLSQSDGVLRVASYVPADIVPTKETPTNNAC